MSREEIRRLYLYASLEGRMFLRTLDRDLEVLADMGITVKVTKAHAVDIFVIDARPFLNEDLSFTATETSALFLATGLWAGIDEGSIEPKIAARTSRTTKRAQEHLRDRLTFAPDLGTLFRAILSRNVVTFSYRSLRGEEQRTVEPWRFLLRGHALYLWGWDCDREADRVFRLSRLTSTVTKLEQGSIRPLPAADAETPFTQLLVAPKMLVRGTALKVLAPFISLMSSDDENATHADNTRQVQNVGVGSVAAKVAEGWNWVQGDSDEYSTWRSRIMTNMDECIVTEPQWLRDEMIALLTECGGEYA